MITFLHSTSLFARCHQDERLDLKKYLLSGPGTPPVMQVSESGVERYSVSVSRDELWPLHRPTGFLLDHGSGSQYSSLPRYQDVTVS